MIRAYAFAGRPQALDSPPMAGWLYRALLPSLARFYERRLDRVLDAALEGRTGTFVDVGAHLGEFLFKVKSRHPRVAYLGFEPNPASCAAVARAIERRGLPDARVVAVALSDRTGIATLRRGSDPTDAEASIVEGFREPSRYAAALAVPVAPGDRLLEDLGVGRVALLKVDAEGAELEVLRGLRGTIARDRPAVLCELLPTYEGDSPLSELRIRRQAALAALLDELGYAVARVLRDGRAVAQDGLVPHSDVARRDFVLAPREALRAILAPRSA
jgi:FkbM family methyltransferase